MVDAEIKVMNSVYASNY